MCVGITPHFSRGRDIWCLTAPPDTDSQCIEDYWLKLDLVNYATLRATRSLRHAPSRLDESDRRSRVWRALRAGLAEGVRDSPRTRLLQHDDYTDQEAGSRKHSGEELQEIRRAPLPGRVRRLIAVV